MTALQEMAGDNAVQHDKQDKYMKTQDKSDRLDSLAGKYLDGDADKAGTKRLKTALEQVPEEDLSPELKALKIMLEGFEGLYRDTGYSSTVRTKTPGAVAAADKACGGTDVKRGIISRAMSRRLRIAIPAAVSAAAAILAAVMVTRPVYGYDSDGRPIRDPHMALAQTECFKTLSVLESNIGQADDLASLLERFDTEKND